MTIPGSAHPLLMASLAEPEAYTISRSLRFNSADSAYLSRTPSSAGNRKTWTWSGWVKRSALPPNFTALFTAGTAFTDSGFFRISMHASGHINVATGATNILFSGGLLRDLSAWYHVLVSVDTTASSNQVKCYLNGDLYDQATAIPNVETAVNSTIEHQIGRDTGETTYADIYLADVHFVDGQALAPTDFGEYDSNNVWQPIEYAGTYGTNGFHLDFSDNSSNAALGTDSSGNNNNWTVNNLQASEGGTVYSASLSTNTVINSGSLQSPFDGNISTDVYGNHPGAGYFLLSGVSVPYTTSLEVYYPSGRPSATVALNGSNVTVNTSGAWNTIATGSGTLTSLQVSRGGDSWFFSAIRVDGTTILIDEFPANCDSLIDTPTNYEAASGNNGGNYCTLNPLKNGQTLSNGNLDVVGGSSWQRSVGTLGMHSGKYYWEYTITASNEHLIGVGPVDMQLSGNLGAGSPPGSGYGTELGQVNGTGANGSWTNTGASGAGDVIGIAFDADNGNMYVYKNGTALNGGIASHTGLVMPQVPVVSLNGSTRSGTVNFGQRPFAYTPPTGYKSLCTTNLPDPTIADGSTVFDAALYTGNGSSSQSITGLNFSPDFVWIKERNSTSAPALVDIVRGTGLRLRTDGFFAETSGLSVTAFNSDGFTVGNDSATNENNKTYVGWTWDGGSSTVSNTAGSLNTSVYNQGQTWSNGLTGLSSSTITNPANAFDGNENSYADSTAGFTLDLSGFVFGTGTHTIELKSGGGTSFTVNGTTSLSTTGSSGAIVWTGTHTGELTSLVSSATGASLYYLKIDGKILVDQGTTPAVSFPSIASTVRANPSAGFSIVTWTGTANATVGHGLNAAPQLVITKSRSNAVAWRIWSAEFSNAASNYLGFDTGGIATFPGTYWGSMTSTTIGLGAGTYDNNVGNMVAYCFAPVEGYSAFGTYTGNGLSDGPFVYTEFRPRWIMVKASSTTGNWFVVDTERDPDNLVTQYLIPNLTNAEGSTFNVDILSNGFKWRASSSGFNGSGTEYLYMAFAEHPLKYARAR